jgi:pimeloyl-ACP methyl ester carboxylesterase
LAEQIAAPTLVVYGRQDKLVNPKAAHAVTKLFPNAHVAVLHDCGHVAQMEHPEEVALLWRRLLHH